MSNQRSWAYGAQSDGHYDLLPPGEYVVEITGTQFRATKRGDGKYLEIEYTIVDGKYSKRKLWNKYNIQNPNPKAVEIARRELAAVRAAIGMPTATAEQMRGGRLIVKVVHRTDNQTGRVYANIVRHARVGGQ